MKTKYKGSKGLMFKAFVVLLFGMMQVHTYAQIGILTNSPDASAQLDIVSNTKGLLIPRIVLTADLTDPSPVSSPAEGLLIFNSGGVQSQGFYYWEGTKWLLIKTPNTEEIEGPSSSTDNAIARFDGTSGKLIQNSNIIINDDDQISLVNSINLAGFQLTTSSVDGKILVSDASGNGSWQDAPPVDVSYNSVLVTSNSNVLNFEGGTNVQYDGSSTATIYFYKNYVTKDVIQLASTSSTDLNTLTDVVPIPWDVEQQKDASTFEHSSSILPERVTVNTTGIYEFNYMFSAMNGTIMRKTLRARLRKNGTTFIDHVTSYSFSYHEADDKITQASSSFLVELQQNDYIELVVNGQTNSGPIYLMPNENLFFIRLIREL